MPSKRELVTLIINKNRRWQATVQKIKKQSPTACGSADWPAMQDHIHYTDSTVEEHTCLNIKPKANSAATAGWAEIRRPIVFPRK
jgi:hypothetical protein